MPVRLLRLPPPPDWREQVLLPLPVPPQRLVMLSLVRFRVLRM
jgi:hypothetical protein